MLLTKRSSSGARRKRSHPQCDTHPLHKDTFHSANDFHPAVTVSPLSPTPPVGLLSALMTTCGRANPNLRTNLTAGTGEFTPLFARSKVYQYFALSYIYIYMALSKRCVPETLATKVKIKKSSNCTMSFATKMIRINKIHCEFSQEFSTSRRATISSRGTGRLNEPLAVTQIVKPEFLGNLCGCHCVRQVLLVCLSNFLQP